MSSALLMLHTGQLGADRRREIFALCQRAFDGDFSADDLDHALGGMHVMIVGDDGSLVGHGAVVQRSMLHDRQPLRVGYVEAVAVDPARQRQGIGTRMMREIGALIGGGFDVGALWASDEGAGLYRSLGWVPWRGRTAVITFERGAEPTPDDDGDVMVLDPRGRLEPHGLLACDWRAANVW